MHLAKKIPEAKCQKCQDFDKATQKAMLNLFHMDEVRHVTTLLAGCISMYRKTLEAMKQDDIHRIKVQSDMDFTCAIFQKFVQTLPHALWSVLDKSLRQNGIVINIQQGKCPHDGQPEQTPPPDQL